MRGLSSSDDDASSRPKLRGSVKGVRPSARVPSVALDAIQRRIAFHLDVLVRGLRGGDHDPFRGRVAAVEGRVKGRPVPYPVHHAARCVIERIASVEGGALLMNSHLATQRSDGKLPDSRVVSFRGRTGGVTRANLDGLNS